jgi:hypothetical protein
MYAQPTAALVDEFYTSIFERDGYGGEMIWVQGTTILVATDRLGGQARRCPQTLPRPS